MYGKSAKFNHMIFNFANLSHSSLVGADFTETNLYNANLSGADLTNAVFMNLPGDVYLDQINRTLINGTTVLNGAILDALNILWNFQKTNKAWPSS